VAALEFEQDPVAVNAMLTNDLLVVTLRDGRSLSVHLDLYPRLLHGSEKERQNWKLLGDGYAIEWPDLDEHIGVEGLLAGRRSGESEASLSRWLSEHVKQSQ
jgi:hypothetical protein